MNKRKSLVLGCMGLLGALALTACTNQTADTGKTGAVSADNSAQTSGSGQTAGQADSSAAGAEQATLRFMWWGGDKRNEATLAVIEQYQKLHPEIRIEAEISSDQGYIDKVSTMLANGTAPDIMQQNVDALPDFVSRGDFFVDFNEYKDAFDASGFEPSFIEQFGSFDGKLLALPTGMSCLATVVNTKAAETTGIDITQQLSWDSILEQGVRLHEAHPDYYLMNVDTKIICEYFLRPWLRQMTGESFIIDKEKKLSFTKEQLVEVVRYIKACYEQGVFEPAEDSAPFKGQTHTNPKWMSGNFIFAFAPSSAINLLSDALTEGDCTVVQMPLAENRVNDGYFSDTPQYMTVNKNSKHVKEAVAFLNYFYNDPQAQETLKDVRSIPPTAAARKLCTEKKLLNPVVVKAVDLAAGLNGKSDKGYTTSSEVYAIQEDMIESVAYGQSTPEEAAENAMELLEDYLGGLK